MNPQVTLSGSLNKFCLYLPYKKENAHIQANYAEDSGLSVEPGHAGNFGRLTFSILL